jgi:acyl dehydratase
MDEVRFTAPNRIGDTIHCEVQVLEITEKGKDKGILTTRNLIKNQKDEILVSFVLKLFCGKKPL